MEKQNRHEANLGTALAEAMGRLDLRGRVNKHPYGTLAAALGAGYVLAGGLLTRLTARTVKLGVRVGTSVLVWPFVQSFVQKELVKVTESFNVARAARSTEVGPGSSVSETRASKNAALRD